jgi:Ca-activated chloride channel family protein
MQTPITAFNVAPSLDRAPEDVQFAIHVAGFAQALRGEPYLRDGYGYEAILEAIDNGLGRDHYGHREEFADLVDIARYAAAQEVLKPGVTPNGRGR